MASSDPDATSGEMRTPPAGTGHGWWPYVLPYAGFLATVETANRVLPESAAGLGLVLKPAVPAALMLYFAWQGAYPELRGARLELGRRAGDALVGIALAALWVAPYLAIDAIRPEGPGFDPTQLGDDRLPLALVLRAAGYALVTPLFEELFIRSFVMRYAEVYAQRGDFRRVPLAQYTLRSFLVTVVVFTIGHVPWEWWVAVPWVAITNLWFYYRKDLYAMIVLHGATNAALLAAAALFGGAPGGDAFSLWVFA